MKAIDATAVALVCFAGIGRADDLPSPAGDAERIFYLADDRLVVLRVCARLDGKPVRDAWDESRNRCFKNWDTNSDGVLAGNELRAVPSPELMSHWGMLTRQGANWAQDLGTLRGEVDRATFKTWLAQIGLEPFSVRIVRSSSVNSPREAVEQLSRTLFQLLDSDGNGRLRADDFRHALHALRKIDLDRDEAISEGEVMSAANSVRNPPPGPDPPLRFLHASSRRPIEHTAQLVCDALDGRIASQGAKDQRLTADELGLGEATMLPFDANQDGSLGLEELEQFLSDPPAHLELTVRLGATGGQRALESSGPLLLDVGAVRIEFVPQNNYADPRVRKAVTELPVSGLFRSFDRDVNGYLDAREMRLFDADPQVFTMLDSNRDERVFHQEFLDCYLPLALLETSRVQVEISDPGHDLFRILDCDRDDRISRREFQAAELQMTNWDRNGDGMAFTEVPRPLKFGVGPGSLMPFRRFLESRPPADVGAQPTTRGPDWFAKMDRNGDGDVSQREFLGPVGTFKKLDGNADGLLDLGEAAAEPKYGPRPQD